MAWTSASELLRDLASRQPTSPQVLQALGQLLSNRGSTTIYVDNDPEAARVYLK